MTARGRCADHDTDRRARIARSGRDVVCTMLPRYMLRAGGQAGGRARHLLQSQASPIGDCSRIRSVAGPGRIRPACGWAIGEQFPGFQRQIRTGLDSDKGAGSSRPPATRLCGACRHARECMPLSRTRLQFGGVGSNARGAKDPAYGGLLH